MSADLKYTEFVKTHFTIAREYGNEVMANCIFHGSDGAPLQINLETGLFICFSCGASGGPMALYRELGITFVEPEEDIATLIKTIREIEKADRTGPVVEKVYPEDYLKRFEFTTDEWIKRDISRIACKWFDLGYYPIGDFLTIPFRNFNGELLGVIRRNLHPDEDAGVPKYAEPASVQKRRHLWGSWLARESDETMVVLVEGPLDAVKVWQAGYIGLAINGSMFTRYQYQILRRLDVERVVLFFDNDAAGRKARDSALGIKHNRRGGEKIETYHEELDLTREFDVRVVDYNGWRAKAIDGTVADDPGEMRSEGIAEMLRLAKKPERLHHG